MRYKQNFDEIQKGRITNMDALNDSGTLSYQQELDKRILMRILRLNTNAMISLNKLYAFSQESKDTINESIKRIEEKGIVDVYDYKVCLNVSDIADILLKTFSQFEIEQVFSETRFVSKFSNN